MGWFVLELLLPIFSTNMKKELVIQEVKFLEKVVLAQIWNLSKKFHRQFHLMSTVLVIKTQKMSENGEIYTADKNITLPPAVTNSTSVKGGIEGIPCTHQVGLMSLQMIHEANVPVYK